MLVTSASATTLRNKMAFWNPVNPYGWGQVWLAVGVACLFVYVFYFDKGQQECVCQMEYSPSPIIPQLISFSKLQPVTVPPVKTLSGQDDPSLLSYIRAMLIPPSSKDVVLSPSNPHKNPHEQQEIYRFVAKLLNNMTNGFFVECGANDGEMYSNTLPLELLQNWTGLLVEPDPKPLAKLKKMNRQSWIMPGCLSVKSHPLKVGMRRRDNNDLLTILSVMDKSKNGEEFVAECFPLFSLLTAINVTTVDYFSLDIEGAELPVLRTIPWDKVLIKVLSIEVQPEKKLSGPVNRYMTGIGYRFVHHVKNSYSHDNIYVHSSLSKAS